MKIKVLSSGSNGNCYILDNGKDVLVLECGISYDIISKELDFNRLCGVLISHSHNDHSKSRANFENWLIPCYSTDNLELGKPKIIGSYKILPMPAYHNVKCFSFWIKDLVTQKNILFATDTTKLPNVADTEFDCMMLEANYSEEHIAELKKQGVEIARGYENHCSVENLVKWLNSRQHNTKTLVLIHLSNRGNIAVKKTMATLKQYISNTIVAKKGTIIKI